MSDSDLEVIRTALAKTISQHRLNTYAAIEDVVNSPAAVVEPHAVMFDQAFAMGSDRYEFNVFVMVANKVTREAQRELDGYLSGKGTKSIREFIFKNRTLGGLNVHANVEQVIKNTYNAGYTVGAVKFVGAALRVCVIVT